MRDDCAHAGLDNSRTEASVWDAKVSCDGVCAFVRGCKRRQSKLTDRAREVRTRSCSRQRWVLEVRSGGMTSLHSGSGFLGSKYLKCYASSTQVAGRTWGRLAPHHPGEGPRRHQPAPAVGRSASGATLGRTTRRV